MRGFIAALLVGSRKVGPGLRSAAWLFRHSVRKMPADGCFTQAAAISFYMLFSLFPLLLFLMGVAGFFLEPADTQARVFDWINRNLPPGARAVVRENIGAIVDSRGPLSLLSLAGLLWSATFMFDAVIEAVNTAWGTKQNLRFLSSKLRSLMIISLIASMALLSTTLTAQEALMLRFEPFVSAAAWIASVALTILAFALTYRFLPRTRVRWREIWAASLLAALFWELSKRGFVRYATGFADYGRIYGSLGAVMVLSLWAYLSALILIWGAEFASLHSRLLRHKFRGPLKHH